MNPDRPKPDAEPMPTQTASAIPYPVESGQRIFPPGAIPTDLLFQGNQENLINHHGEYYRLCITRNGKLILTK